MSKKRYLYLLVSEKRYLILAVIFDIYWFPQALRELNVKQIVKKIAFNCRVHFLNNFYWHLFFITSLVSNSEDLFNRLQKL